MAWPLPAVGTQGLLLNQNSAAALRTKFIPKAHLDQNVPYFRDPAPRCLFLQNQEVWAVKSTPVNPTVKPLTVQPQRVNPNNKHRVFQCKNERSKRRTQLRKERRAHTGRRAGPCWGKAGDTEMGTQKRLGAGRWL